MSALQHITGWLSAGLRFQGLLPQIPNACFGLPFIDDEAYAHARERGEHGVVSIAVATHQNGITAFVFGRSVGTDGVGLANLIGLHIAIQILLAHKIGIIATDPKRKHLGGIQPQILGIACHRFHNCIAAAFCFCWQDKEICSTQVFRYLLV